MPSEEIKTYFSKLRDTIQKQLSIPNYQRPYEWTDKNVVQLLSDINNARKNGKAEYLIGSLIFHHDPNKPIQFDIVDGQQRLTTFFLILKALKYDGTLPDLTYNHSLSFYHVKENFNFIRQWISDNLAAYEHQDFIDFILESCWFVEIVVSRLSEAFQLFETQNGRGKELEAYNLLKAYHLRAMKEDSQSDKIESDVRWESAALFEDKNVGRMDILRQVINEHLYRVRTWSKGKEAGRFSKKKVDEFKGLTLGKNESLDFAYQNIMLQQQIATGFLKAMNQGLFKVKDRFLHGDPDNMNPFVSINQLIVNGKPFFEYVETYIEMYKRLFLNTSMSQLAEFKTFYNNFCKNYRGAYRVGDGYIRQVYKSAILLVFDRFGERGVLDIYKDIYTVLYFLRLSLQQIKYNTMIKRDNSGWIFSTINNAKSLSELAPIRQKAREYRNIIKRDENKVKFRVDEILSVITDNNSQE